MRDSPSALLDVHRIPIDLTASPDLVDLARACVADGSISDPETPSLLRQIAWQHLGAVAAYAAAIERPAPPRIPIAEGFVLVDYEARPGVRSYRLARIPANVPWRIRIGAFERLLHRTLVLFVRRLVWFLTAQLVLAPEGKGSLLARPRGRGGPAADPSLGVCRVDRGQVRKPIGPPVVPRARLCSLPDRGATRSGRTPTRRPCR